MIQDIQVVGDGNTVIQIQGDGNTVFRAAPHLNLTRYMARRKITQDLDLISPYSRSIPLVGRNDELDDLRAFINARGSLRIRVIIGGGGSGKTRLALELCEELSVIGWHAGFVGRSELKRFHAQQNFSEWGWGKPTLIVVDYAAEHAHVLCDLLDELAERTQPDTHPLRFLLLERTASTQIGWWKTVFAAGGFGDTNKRAVLDPAEPVHIRQLTKVEDRLAVLAEMLKLADVGARITVPLDDSVFRDHLMKITWGGDPLFLMMAALTMTEMGYAKSLTLGRTDLAHALASREANRLEKLSLAAMLNPKLVQHLAACVTLTKGMVWEDFEHFAAAERTLIQLPNGGDPADLADLLGQALPEGSRISPIEPDLIGEAFVLHVLKSQKGTETVLRCAGIARSSVVESTIRIAQDFSPKSSEPLDWLDALSRIVWDDLDGLVAFDASLSVGSVTLREISFKVAERLQHLIAANPKTPLPQRATALIGLAVALSGIGNREAALKATQKAVEIYRELVEQSGPAFRLHLARALNNLSSVLGELNKHEAALKVVQESVTIFRGLSQERPDVLRPDMAMALNNLSAVLWELGEREAALKVAQESVSIRRDLAQERPNEFRPALAGSLNNLAITLHTLGQREAALIAAQDSAELFRELAQRRPDVFLPALAGSLNILANILGALSKHEAAMNIAKKVTEIYRDLASQRPNVFRLDLAGSLNNLANNLNKRGEHEAALNVALEGAEIYRDLAQQQPGVFRPALAMSLSNLSNRLCELGQHEAALKLAQEAAGLHRTLAEQQPNVFRPDFAGSLHVLARRTEDSVSEADALPIARDAVATLKPEFLRWPDAHSELMRLTLNHYLQLCNSTKTSRDQDLIHELISI